MNGATVLLYARGSSQLSSFGGVRLGQEVRPGQEYPGRGGLKQIDDGAKAGRRVLRCHRLIAIRPTFDEGVEEHRFGG